MTSIVLRTGWLALGLQCAVALAQDDDGATRAQRAADNPLRLIIEAGKLKPRAKGDDADASAKPAADPKAVAPKPVAAKAAAPQVGTLPDVPSFLLRKNEQMPVSWQIHFFCLITSVLPFRLRAIRRWPRICTTIKTTCKLL